MCGESDRGLVGTYDRVMMMLRWSNGVGKTISQVEQLEHVVRERAESVGGAMMSSECNSHTMAWIYGRGECWSVQKRTSDATASNTHAKY